MLFQKKCSQVNNLVATYLSFKSRLSVGGLSEVLFIPNVEDFFLRNEYDFLKKKYNNL